MRSEAPLSMRPSPYEPPSMRSRKPLVHESTSGVAWRARTCLCLLGAVARPLPRGPHCTGDSETHGAGHFHVGRQVHQGDL
eukprot:8183570-Alexandrium_andersonii.AAC.1